MIAYSEKTTEELIELLIAEEDRVTLQHILELVARTAAAEPLRELLQDEYYWYDADPKESWSLYHAFIVLCLKRDKPAFPALLDALKRAHETDYDYLTEISHAALSQYGEFSVEPLMEFIRELKGKQEDDWVLSYPRSDAVTALVRVALENPALRSRITDFILELLADETDTDSTFLSFICDDGVLLDRERGLAAVQAAYERDLIDESINGDFEFFKQDTDSNNKLIERKYKKDVFDFYQPTEIALRQEQRRQEEETLKRLVEEREQRKAESVRMRDSLIQRIEPIIPVGFAVTDAGNFVREEKIGRNDPCPCLSGKKYKKCHGK